MHFLPDETTLREAAQNGGVKALRELIAAGCRPSAEQASKIPMEVASAHGQLEVVKFLIGADDDVDNISRGLISAAGTGDNHILQGINIFPDLFSLKFFGLNYYKLIYCQRIEGNQEGQMLKFK